MKIWTLVALASVTLLVGACGGGDQQVTPLQGAVMGTPSPPAATQTPAILVVPGVPGSPVTAAPVPRAVPAPTRVPIRAQAATPWPNPPELGRVVFLHDMSSEQLKAPSPRGQYEAETFLLTARDFKTIGANYLFSISDFTSSPNFAAEIDLATPEGAMAGLFGGGPKGYLISLGLDSRVAQVSPVSETSSIYDIQREPLRESFDASNAWREGWNRLGIISRPPELWILLNGQVVGYSTSVPGLENGNLGVHVTSSLDESVTAVFDNFRLRQLHSANATRQSLRVAFVARPCDSITSIGQCSYFYGERYDSLYIMNDDLTEITRIAEAVKTPEWLAGGSKMAFVSTASGDPDSLYLVGSDGQNETKLPIELASKTEIIWSPNSESILYSGRGTVQLMTLSGEVLEREDLPTGDPAAAFTPGGPKFALWRHDLGVLRIHDLNSGDHIEVSDVGGGGCKNEREKCPKTLWWSPDGRKLLVESGGAYFVVSYAGGPSLKLMPKIKSERFKTESTVDKVAWSPDSKHLAYQIRDGSVYIIKADGSTDTKIGDGSPDSPLSWSADAEKLAFLGEVEGPLRSARVVVYSVETLTSDFTFDLSTAEWRMRLVFYKPNFLDWAPDGRMLFVATDLAGGKGLGLGYLIDLVTNDVLNVRDILIHVEGLELHGNFIWIPVREVSS